MKPFDGNPAIRLLKFLAQIRDYFDMIGAKEALAVRILAYLLGGEARDVL